MKKKKIKKFKKVSFDVNVNVEVEVELGNVKYDVEHSSLHSLLVCLFELNFYLINNLYYI